MSMDSMTTRGRGNWQTRNNNRNAANRFRKIQTALLQKNILLSMSKVATTKIVHLLFSIW